jgi:hypothetical protein
MSSPTTTPPHGANPSTAIVRMDELAGNLLRFGATLGVACLAVTAMLGARIGDGGKQFMHSYLLALCFFTSIGIGALFFVILQYLTRAGWSIVVRRLAEILATSLPLMAVLFLPILVGMAQGNSTLYPWVDTVAVQKDALLAGKAPYLNVPFFFVRFALYTLIWGGLSWHYLRQSMRQDRSGDLQITARLQSFSAPAMILFALSTTFFAFDLLMSLQPHWYSTIFGVYYFAGSVLAFICTVVLIGQGLQRAGYLKGVIHTEHYHDLGKFMFGFTFFWGYIAFSQYLLIWYSNMPEETEWFLQRQTGQWVWVSLALLFGHFLIPFPGLLSRHVKRHPVALALWAGYMLAMHWIDLYWLIMPSLARAAPPFGAIDLLAFLGVGGLFVANFGYVARDRRLVPEHDPRLAESLAFENA